MKKGLLQADHLTKLLIILCVLLVIVLIVFLAIKTLTKRDNTRLYKSIEIFDKLKNVVFSFFKKYVLFVVLVVVCVGSTIWCDSLVKKHKINNAIRTVKCLYDFQNLQELDGNMDTLRTLVSEDVYEKLTIDNTDTALNKYLKFKQSACKVKVVKATDTYVHYHIDTPSLTAGRNFIFFYKTSPFGTITEVREMEGIDFEKHSN